MGLELTPSRGHFIRTEFKQQMVELVRAGRTPAELGRELKCSAQSISSRLARDAADMRAPQHATRSREREALWWPACASC